VPLLRLSLLTKIDKCSRHAGTIQSIQVRALSMAPKSINLDTTVLVTEFETLAVNVNIAHVL
jgi:hypothetical protein